LRANLGPLTPRTRILEFTIQDSAIDIAEHILLSSPRIVGFGVYIWNVEQTRKVIEILKSISPHLTIVLGGPEVSYETEQQSICSLADYIITGEADHAFRELCTALIQDAPPPSRIIHAVPPKAESLALPYDLYHDEDIRQRVLYVEASRGCPFTCEFCLSSLDIPVRQFALPDFLTQIDALIERGARQFKFVDRTFNLNIRTSTHILEFFLARMDRGLFVHFEMVPDRLPPALRQTLARFPAGSIQLEVGIQTFNPEVAALISRRQNYAALEDNLRFLRQETGVYIHADLIAGLPGEDLDSFAHGFDRLVVLAPQEIQVGILKRLRGAPIARHSDAYQMVYASQAPYEILQTKDLSFEQLQMLRRFARTWHQIANSGSFCGATPLLWESPNTSSPFFAVMEFSEWLNQQYPASSGRSLTRLAQAMYNYLVTHRGIESEFVLTMLSNDFDRLNRTDKPQVLADFERSNPLLRDRLRARRSIPQPSLATPARQQRHLAG
jgi:tRNA A37 methylthiotransferase MiaB